MTKYHQVFVKILLKAKNLHHVPSRVKINLCNTKNMNNFRLEDLNPLLAGVPLIYPLKTSENLRFSVLRGYKKGTPSSNGLQLNSMKRKPCFSKPDYKTKNEEQVQNNKEIKIKQNYFMRLTKLTILLNYFFINNLSSPI